MRVASPERLSVLWRVYRSVWLLSGNRRENTGHSPHSLTDQTRHAAKIANYIMFLFDAYFFKSIYIENWKLNEALCLRKLP